VRLDNLAEHEFPDGNWVSFGLSGFYANYRGSNRSHCSYTLTTDCAFINIVDFDPKQENNTGPFGNLDILTKRDVDYYGVSVEARFGNWAAASLKDDVPAKSLSPLRIGLSMRAIDETAKLYSVDQLVCDPVKYKELLNTHYYGGYVGLEKQYPIGASWSLSLDATAGLYYADTQYEGRYSGYTPVFGSGYVQETGAVNESAEKGAFIGTIRAGLDRDFGWGKVGVFGQAEYLSYAPRISYNNNDQAGGSPWGVEGNRAGTHIVSDDAFNYTGGISVTFKMR